MAVVTLLPVFPMLPVLPVLPIVPLFPVVSPMPGVSVVETYTRPRVSDTVVTPCDGRFWVSVTCRAPESIDSSVLPVSGLEPVLLLPSV